MKTVIQDIFFKQMQSIQKTIFNPDKDLPFLPERKKITKSKKACLQHRRRKKICYSHKSLKKVLNHKLILKRVHGIIQFNQKAWLKQYIVMNTSLRKEAKNEFEKDFFELMNNSVFGKTMENVRKHRDIKLVTTEERKSKLVSEPNYHTTRDFSENLLAIEMKKTKVIMNKSVYFGL